MAGNVSEPQEWYQPFNPEREEDGETVIGCHKGPTYHLNIRNPQPGMVYYYEANRANRLRRRQVEGWDYVRQSDPERWGTDLPEDVQAELGDVRMSKDVVLMRIGQERYAELVAEKERTTQLARGGAVEEHLARGFDAQQRLNNYGVHTDEDLYYKSPHHGEDTG